MRHWYAWYNRFGRIAITSPIGREYYVYLAFSSPKARNVWVEEHEFKDAHYVAGKISRKEIERDIGKFYISRSVCIKRHTWGVDYAEKDYWAYTMSRMLLPDTACLIFTA